MAKSLLAGIVLICMFSSLGWAATPSPTLIATPPQPKWSELTVPQKAILAPLADDWDSFEYYRQKQWRGITARFPTMSSGEQSRIQKQMQEWGKLTPAQRQKARENFLSTAQLPAEKKEQLKQKWEEYSKLPPEEKARLIAKEPAYGRVICRCETITEGEILDALQSEIPAVSIDGVKRRCNAGMGRCQGGFCGPRVLELISKTLGISPLDVLQDKAGTNVLLCETKQEGEHHD